MLKRYINVAFAPRFAQIGLGVWMFATCYLWERYPNPTMLVAFAGALVGTFALMSLVDSRVRYANVFMGILLMGEGIFVHQYFPFCRIHDVVVGALILLVSFVPNPDMTGTELDLGRDSSHH